MVFHKNNLLRFIAFALIVFFLVGIALLMRNSGLLYFTDTVSYLDMTDRINKGFFPHSDSFSPGYPFLMAMVSKLFSTSEIQTVYTTSFILIFSVFCVLYQLIKSFIDNKDQFSFKSFILVFILLANWLLLKIILTAHADLFFLFLLSLYFLGLVKWLFFEEKNGFYLLLTTIVLSVWIKYNAIVLVPFSILSIFFYGKKKTIQYAFPIVILLIAFCCSYALFKQINGTVIQHLQPDSFSVKISKSIQNLSLLSSNYSLSGKVFLGAVFSKSLELLIPKSVATLFMFVLTFLFIYMLTSTIKRREKENIFLFFSFFYWVIFYALCQYTGWEEINARTLFPSILTMLIWLFLQQNKSKLIGKRFINAVIAISVLYSLCYVVILNRSEQNKFLNHLSDFKHKKIVQNFIERGKQNNFAGNIFSNDARNISFALGHIKVNDYPKKKLFQRGKFREISEREFSMKQAEFCNQFSTHTSALLIFNDTLDAYIDSCLKNTATKIIKSENDILIIHAEY